MADWFTGLAGWLVGWLAGQVSCLVGWLVSEPDWLAAWSAKLAGLLAAWLAGWLACWLAGCRTFVWRCERKSPGNFRSHGAKSELFVSGKFHEISTRSCCESHSMRFSGPLISQNVV